MIEENAVRRIELSQEFSAIVDAQDYDRLSKFKWSVLISSGGKMYATRQFNYTDSIANFGAQRVYLHREVLKAGPGQRVRILNKDGLDCRRSNLRIMDPSSEVLARLEAAQSIRPLEPFTHENRWIFRDSRRANPLTGAGGLLVQALASPGNLGYRGFFDTVEAARKARDEQEAGRASFKLPPLPWNPHGFIRVMESRLRRAHIVMASRPEVVPSSDDLDGLL